MILAKMAKKTTDKTDKEEWFKVRDSLLGYDEAGLLAYKSPQETPYKVLNLSTKGVEFIATGRVEKGTKVDITISCPAYLNPMICRGKVVSIRRVTKPKVHYRITVEFSKMEKRAQKQLHNLSKDPMLRKRPKGSPFIASD